MFEVFKEKEALKLYLNKVRVNQQIGFVPTMGALHQGHLSLIKKSFENNFITVISIFVNPTQFNNQDDLEKYPRTLQADLNKIKTSFSKNIIVYAPEVSDLYKDQVISKRYRFGGLEHQLEGAFRPGHFDGVGTIVEMLLNLIEPQVAYFGEKDFQQLQIIKKLVAIKKINTTIVGCEIFRESNGLAMSSRNERLSQKSKEEAKIIFDTLQEIKRLFCLKSIQKLKKLANDLLSKNQNIRLEYFEIADETTLKPAKRKYKNKNYRAFVAVFLDNIRLIDNIKLN